VQRADARAKIWASLSEAADQQQIASQVLQIDQTSLPAINAVSTNPAKLP
jgi:hypothetical protein